MKKVAKPRNLIAASLAAPQFQKKVVKDKTKYTRKQKHKGGKSVPTLDSFKGSIKKFYNFCIL
jgi:hypothetical protein